MDHPLMALIALTLLTLLVASAYYIRYQELLKVQAKRTNDLVDHLMILRAALKYAHTLDDPTDFLRAYDRGETEQEKWSEWRAFRSDVVYEARQLRRLETGVPLP